MGGSVLGIAGAHGPAALCEVGAGGTVHSVRIAPRIICADGVNLNKNAGEH